MYILVYNTGSRLGWTVGGVEGGMIYEEDSQPVNPFWHVYGVVYLST